MMAADVVLVVVIIVVGIMVVVVVVVVVPGMAAGRPGQRLLNNTQTPLTKRGVHSPFSL